VGVLLLVLLEYGGLFFYFFSLFWQVSSLEKVSEASRRPVRVNDRDLGQASTVVFLEAKFALFRRLLLDMCPPALFIIVFWRGSRFSRPCVDSVADTWSSHAWVVFYFG
jgi:hypothetical protein